MHRFFLIMPNLFLLMFRLEVHTTYGVKKRYLSTERGTVKQDKTKG